MITYINEFFYNIQDSILKINLYNTTQISCLRCFIKLTIKKKNRYFTGIFSKAVFLFFTYGHYLDNSLYTCVHVASLRAIRAFVNINVRKCLQQSKYLGKNVEDNIHLRTSEWCKLWRARLIVAVCTKYESNSN